jgi:hypothetical protein
MGLNADFACSEIGKKSRSADAIQPIHDPLLLISSFHATKKRDACGQQTSRSIKT